MYNTVIRDDSSSFCEIFAARASTSGVPGNVFVEQIPGGDAKAVRPVLLDWGFLEALWTLTCWRELAEGGL